METEGPTLDARIQGGILTDGLGSLLSGLFTTLPNTTFSQNNGVISLTRCANKATAAVALLFFGIIAKIAAIIATIPECVLGGMTCFLFVNIIVLGVKILVTELSVRRNRFIVAAPLAVSLGVALVPAWADNDLVRTSATATKTTKLLAESVVIILTTPYCIGTLITMFLHAIVPYDEVEAMDEPAAILVDTELSGVTMPYTPLRSRNRCFVYLGRLMLFQCQLRPKG